MPDEATLVEDIPEAAPAEAALSPLLEDVVRPIPGDDPCGIKVTYDDDYLAVKKEVDEIGTVSGGIDQEKATAALEGGKKKQMGLQESIFDTGGGVDYQKMVDLGRKILATKSKDLNVACYMALGLSRTQGMEGLAEGITAVRLLMETFWEGLYPEKHRMVGRRNALQFLATRLNDTLERTEAEPDDRAALERALAELKQMQAFTMKEMEDQAPSLSGLARSFETAIRKLPKAAEPEPEPVPAPAAPAGEAPTPAASREAAAPSTPVARADAAPSVAAPSVSAGDLKTGAQATMVVTQAATFLREQDGKSPVPYRLLRVLRWGVLASEPPSEGEETRIPPPPAPRRTFLAGLFEKGQHEKLVQEAEASLQQNPFHFWLDLQRLSVTSLEALGGAYTAVAEAVLEETALLLKRLPKLPSLSFNDGTPFADPLTVDWIEGRVYPALGGGGGGGRGVNPALQGRGEHLGEQYEEARRLLTKGDLAGALARMQEGIAQDFSPKDRFLRQLYLATLCLKGNQPAVARPLLEGLAEEVTHHNLAAWDPGLALEVWSNLYTCYDRLKATDDDGAYRQKAAGLFEKICRIDAGYALAVLG